MMDTIKFRLQTSTILYKSDNFLLTTQETDFKLKHIKKLERVLIKHFLENDFDNYEMFQRTSINLKSSFLNEYTIKSKLPITFYFDNEYKISNFSVRQQITTIINLLNTIYTIQNLNK
jgi:hypothetical protein